MIDPKNLNEVVHILHHYGVKHFKSADFEISFRADTVTSNPEVFPLPKMNDSSVLRPVTKDDSNASLTPEKEEEIKHQIVEVASLMKLDDNSLVDQLFPDHTSEVDGGE